MAFLMSLSTQADKQKVHQNQGQKSGRIKEANRYCHRIQQNQRSFTSFFSKTTFTLKRIPTKKKQGNYS